MSNDDAMMSFSVIAVLALVAIGLYFLPSNIAGRRRHHRFGTILILNIVFGWTGIGWLALVLYAALSEKEGAWAYRERMARAERLAQDAAAQEATAQGPVTGASGAGAPQALRRARMRAPRASFMDHLRGAEDTASPALFAMQAVGAVLSLLFAVAVVVWLAPALWQGITQTATRFAVAATTGRFPTRADEQAAAQAAQTARTAPREAASGATETAGSANPVPTERNASEVRDAYVAFREAEAACLREDEAACARRDEAAARLLDMGICNVGNNTVHDGPQTLGDCWSALPAEIEGLAKRFAETNSACRGGRSGPENDAICAQRDAVVDSVYTAGWCLASPFEQVVSCAPYVPPTVDRVRDP